MVREKSFFVAPNDPILVQIALPILPSKISSSAMNAIVSQMLDVAYGNRTDRSKPTVVGLAAPQIGFSRRIIAVDIGAGVHGELADLRVYINPEISWASEDTEEWCEGCWSTGRVCGVVTRAKEVMVEAYTTEGKRIAEKFGGYVARIFQHEIDHLNGIEFVQHITDDAKLHWVEESEWEEYKIKEGWRNWQKKCSRGKWMRIKKLKK